MSAATNARKTSKIRKIQTVYEVTEYRLENGLRVLYRRDRTMPVVAVCVTYHVGSRNEAAGHTGATHILEHLMFKDSKKFSKANGNGITDYLEWFGAIMNATTWVDRTNYFEVLPKEHFEEALSMEADRMRGSLFNDTDLASEMTVVRNEYEQSRNNPYELLSEEVMATAFTLHPYRIPTIGTKEDIEASTAAKLREFYNTYYWPNNATLAIIGDVSRDEMEEAVVKHFGPIQSSPHPIPPFTLTEPGQSAARQVQIKKQVGVSIVQLAYKSPEATHADFIPLSLAASILAGGFSARMQQHIVDKGYAADISMFVLPTHDPGLLTFTATVADGVDPDKVLKMMRSEVGKFVDSGIQKTELDRARTRALVQHASSLDGIFREVHEISEAIAAGDWKLAYKYNELVKSVTVADIRRVARAHLTSSGETTGILFNTV